MFLCCKDVFNSYQYVFYYLKKTNFFNKLFFYNFILQYIIVMQPSYMEKCSGHELMIIAGMNDVNIENIENR